MLASAVAVATVRPPELMIISDRPVVTFLSLKMLTVMAKKAKVQPRQCHSLAPSLMCWVVGEVDWNGTATRLARGEWTSRDTRLKQPLSRSCCQVSRSAL